MNHNLWLIVISIMAHHDSWGPHNGGPRAGPRPGWFTSEPNKVGKSPIYLSLNFSFLEAISESSHFQVIIIFEIFRGP